MKSSLRRCIIVIVAVLIPILACSIAAASDPLTLTCSELVRSAQSIQDDLKTVDMVLGSAISAGTMSRVKKYKLRKAEIEKKLSTIMRAIDVKGCVNSK
jgi:hypothetical protein